MSVLGQEDLQIIKNGLKELPTSEAGRKCDHLLRTYGYRRTSELESTARDEQIIAAGLAPSASNKDRQKFSDLLRKFDFIKIESGDTRASARTKPGPKPQASNVSRRAIDDCLHGVRLLLGLDESKTELQVLALLNWIFSKFSTMCEGGLFLTVDDVTRIAASVSLLPNSEKARELEEMLFAHFRSAERVGFPPFLDGFCDAACENMIARGPTSPGQLELLKTCFNSSSRPKAMDSAYRRLPRILTQMAGACFVHNEWLLTLMDISGQFDGALFSQKFPLTIAADVLSVIQWARLRQNSLLSDGNPVELMLPDQG